MVIDCDFPGGNIIVEKIESNDVYLKPDMRDTRGSWFYWYFRIRNIDKRNLKFHFPNNFIGVFGPSISIDKGQTWKWVGKQSKDGNSFSFAFQFPLEEVRFCVGIPYLNKNLSDFLENYHNNKIKITEHCITRKGRIVPRLHLGCCDNPDYRILITCRHHCCEMMASYVLEGMMEKFLCGDKLSKWFCKNTEMVVIPFMDMDGVEDGDQGKNRSPRDHNRDYSGDSIYPETRTIREFVPKWSNDKLIIAFDMHCPGLHEEKLYLYEMKQEVIVKEINIFSNILESLLPYYSVKDNLPYGTGYNSDKTYSEGRSFTHWIAEEIPSIKLVSSVEIPYASIKGYELNQKTTKIIGHNFLNAIYNWITYKS